MRLNKYIAAAGVASRRKADELTKNGNVKINGQTVTAPGTDVAEGDRVEVNGLAVRPETRFLYLLLNKPKGYITTASDEKGRPTVLELITDIEQRLFPVGRLDANTTGMLLLTNDGDFAQRISHPSNETSKTYRARVTGVLSKEKLAQLRRGVDIGGFTTSPAEITLLKQTGSSAVVDITIHEGKNHQVRRMFAAVGSKVLELERTAIGTVRLGNLKSGHYRKLKKPEIEALLK
ncbi:MAG: rRNA pseudouridine synthase [Clostridiales Family XIII bacterium]|jgi:23S rRNA pseudouridine2605 synthase|nr:rRNA pseudouridine synthase [Clostridiales Family XIII bacterium]